MPLPVDDPKQPEGQRGHLDILDMNCGFRTANGLRTPYGKHGST